MAERPSFALVLRPEPGIEPRQALRQALRRLLRDHGLRCLKVAELPAEADPPT